MYVVTSGPVMAFQAIGGIRYNNYGTVSNNPEPNQGLFVVPPLNCAAKGEINNIPLLMKLALLIFKMEVLGLSQKMEKMCF
jgi:hypothetical protein